MSTTAPKKPLTIIARGSDGTVTVRTNTSITFGGSIPFNGSISGTIPAGATFKGRDANRNGIPDLLQRQINNGSVRFN